MLMTSHTIRATTSPDRPSRVQRAERITQSAWIDLLDAAGRGLRQRLGLDYQRLGQGVVLRARGLDHLIFNRVIGASSEEVGEAAAIYRRAAIPRFLISLPREQLGRAEEAARAHALQRFRRPWALFVQDVRAAPADSIRSFDPLVRLRAARAGDAPAVARLFCEGFDAPRAAAALIGKVIGRPGWDVIVATVGEEIAAFGMLYSSEGAGCLFAASTAEPYRRRGLQRAIVRQRLPAATARGVDLLTSETGVAVPGEPNSSWDNLARAGFEVVQITEHLCPEGSRWGQPQIRPPQAGLMVAAERAQ